MDLRFRKPADCVNHVTFGRIRERLAELEPERPDRTGRREASVAVVLAGPADADVELLLIRRAVVEGDPWSGQMGLPGGRREPRDADLLGTARRETLEETGIALPLESLLGELHELAPTTPVLPPVVVRPYVFGLPTRPATRTSHEVAAVVWVPLKELPRTERVTSVTVRGVERTVPAFVVGRHVVWGMTHRILKPLINLVAE